MAKHLILSLFTYLSFSLSYGQKLGEYYIPVSMDSTRPGQLRFLSDSTVEISDIPRHMGWSLKAVFNYVSTDTTIEIVPNSISKQYPTSVFTYSVPFVMDTKLILTKIDHGFIDYKKSIIYIRQKYFDNDPDLNYIIDGKIYIQDMGVTDGYGIVKKIPKRNRALERRLKSIDYNTIKVEIVRGLKAYERFGIDKVNGVIVITSKK